MRKILSNVFKLNKLTKYQTRTLHILDNAESLLLHYGYSKVTIDDIASACNLGKGTIYLHWRSKENLFYAVFLKASAEITHNIIEAIEHDPSTVLIENLMVKAFTLCAERKILSALFTLNSKLLGKLISNKSSSASRQLKYDAIKRNLEMYRKYNYVKTDVPIDIQVHIVSMILLGMFNYNSYFSQSLALEDQKLMLSTITKNSLSIQNSKEISRELYDFIKLEFTNMLNFYRDQVFKSTLKKA